MTMTGIDKAYDDLIEIGARVVAFSDLTGRALPPRVHDLISEAADLRGAWDTFSANGTTPGCAELPIVDAVIDEVYLRANALRCQIFGQVRYSDTAPEALDDLAERMRDQLGRSRVPY
jgi:hypothetical protein